MFYLKEATMTFDEATTYKLIGEDGREVFYSRDELALFIHNNNLAYRYVPKSQRRGTLELFNDDIDLVFNVILYNHF